MPFRNRIVNLITFELPYYSIYEMTRVCGRKRREVWKKLPFRNLESPTILPDGNIIISSWEDHFYEWDVYHDSPYDQFFKPRQGDTIVDAGAHVGFYTLKAAKEVGNKGQVVAVEPEDNNFRLLSQNIQINKYKNIIPVKLALSDFEGKARFFLKARSCSHSLVGKTWATPIVDVTETTVTTLDKLLDKLLVKKVDILKINVEGAEAEVLRGSRTSLAERRISNVIVTPHPPYNQEADRISRYLETYGYKTKVVADAQILYASLS